MKWGDRLQDFTVSAILRGLRARDGKTQEQVSEACGISKVALARYETGSRKPRIEIASRLAEYYGVSVDYILGRDDAQKPPAPPINPHTYYAKRFGPETQRIVDDLLSRLQAMPEDRQADASRGALTYVRGVVNAEEQEGKA